MPRLAQSCATGQIGAAVQHQAERAAVVVVDQQHDRAMEVRVEELRHRHEESR